MPHDHSCWCCSSTLRELTEAAAKTAMSRRNLLAGVGSAAMSSWVLASGTAQTDSKQTPSTRPALAPSDQLVVHPILTYQLYEKREQTSWRPWGGLHTAEQVADEVKRINKELQDLVASSNLPVKLLPVSAVRTNEEAAKARQLPCDTMLLYPANNGGVPSLESLISADPPTIVFLRHRSGPVSLWYEILHPIFMRNHTDDYAKKGIDVNDVVVDEYGDLAWRLRALAALRKTRGQRIVAIGGAGGWGLGGKLAPPNAREKWQLDIRDVSYPALGERIEKLRRNDAAVADATRQAGEYLADKNVTLKTDRKAVENAFLLYRVFKDVMAEHDAKAMTIISCMSTIMPMSQTTACLPLSLINDEGLLAFCESDFVVIPVGMLMHHIMGTPVFLNDPTWPHHGLVTVAHCTAPRRMDGRNLEPVEIHTHFESDYGAAPKVAMRPGQVITMVVPDFGSQKYVGFKGTVAENPFHDICRSQSDIAIDGDCQKLLEDMRGFHWMMVYGDCRKEIGYAIKRLGIQWQDISA